MTGRARALVILAEGAEEMEVTITVDVLRRGGVEVTLAGLDGDQVVRCSRGVRLVPDVALAAVDGLFDAIVLPGGAGGAERLAASAEVGRRLRAHAEGGKHVAAVCAGPAALVAHQVGAGRRMTSHPSVRARVDGFARWEEGPVVADGALVTGAGPGPAFAFALALVARLVDRETADRVAAELGPVTLAGG